MQISKINNAQSFRALNCGDLKKIITISREGGLAEQAVESLLNEVQTILPNPKDRIFFIFRKPFREKLWRPMQIRSQIEVLKEGDMFNLKGLRANVYPFECEPKDLLEIFVRRLINLMNGDIKPERLSYFEHDTRKLQFDKYLFDINMPVGRVNFQEGL